MKIKTLKNMRIVLSMMLFAVLMMSCFASVSAQTTSGGKVDTSGSPPDSGYVGPTTVPANEKADYVVYPQAFLSVSPNPIGVNQELLVNVWITFPSGEGKYMSHYSVIITDPDGQTQEVRLVSYVADGTSWFAYTPYKTGTYQFQFFFAGEYSPEGYYMDGNHSYERTGAFANAIYNPDIYVAPAQSPITYLTVQEGTVYPWQLKLADDSYWTHPVQPNMRDSWEMLGHYPYSYGNIVNVAGNAWHDNWYGPFVPAVTTPHIVWKRTANVAGLIGGEGGAYSALSSPGTPSVIYMGRAYQTRYETINGVPTNCAVCYDLRTGELIYAIPVSQGGVTPAHITYVYPGGSNVVPGSIADQSLTVELSAINGGVLRKINPTTGVVTNVTIPVFSGNGSNMELFFREGIYYSFQGIKTNTANPAPDVTVTESYDGFLIAWTSAGTTSNFNSRIISNVSITLPTSYRTPYQTSNYGNVLGAVDYDAMITVQQHRFIYGGFYGYSLEAIDLTTGKTLWTFTSDVNEMSSAYRPTNCWVRNGRYIAQMELGSIKAWDLQTGKELWETYTHDDYPWGEFWMYDEAAYMNLIYSTGYTGVWAHDETDGSLVWQYAYEAPPFETPYSSNGMATYTVQDIRVIGGYLYVSDNEHTPSQPAQRGWGMRCLDGLTGELLWKISGTRMQAGASAYGYLTAASNYDGTMYVLGKGQSKTSISGPQTAITKGSSIVLTGKVLDQSPASTAITPEGIACVADECMDMWMDYIYLQMPMGGLYGNKIVKGVEVFLTAENEHGEYTYIGEAYTDSSGTFSFLWTPEEVGKYTVTATFGGSEAYGSSFDTTAIGVVEESESSSQPNFGLYIACSTIAIIVVVLLIGFLLLKKK
jgi:hypothetical protein